MSKKKKIILIASISAAVLLVAGGLYWLFSGVGASGQKVYVQPVSEILGLGTAGVQNRYAGVIESQKTLKIELDPSKTLAEVFVKEGDEVKAGDPLFSYDVDELKLNLEQLNLDLESTKSSITTMQEQIAALKKEKASAPQSEQLQYTIQIQTLEVNIMQAEYTIKTKTAEVEKAKNAIEHAVVTAEMDGVVRELNQSGGEQQPSYGDGTQSSFMTITATGSFRVKGLVGEQFVYMLSEGMPVIIRSRTDENAIWRGTIQLIDIANPVKGNNNMMYYDGMASQDDTTSASKYPFYVELESSENLLMGQHVYIEPDMGQGAQKEGIWLPSAYLILEDEKAFVYAANSWDKIEKRSIEHGEYDEMADSYEILKGIDLEDRIAFPEDFIQAGMGVTDAPNYGGGEDDLPDNSLPGADDALPGGDEGIMPRSNAVALEE